MEIILLFYSKIIIKFVLQALEELNGSNLDGATLEVSLAKPPSDKKKKEEILRARERRMFTNMQGRAFGQLPYIFINL